MIYWLGRHPFFFTYGRQLTGLGAAAVLREDWPLLLELDDDDEAEATCSSLDIGLCLPESREGLARCKRGGFEDVCI